ncbi:Transcription elongation factor spt6 [Coemansia sp. RSA 2167]|nr:Transcription elongation factor spt6 [Coemansia sp. RSA 2167]KAJ2154157.1 Transcription elongation factor spt6 [Coemansia sp. RSA 637]KAJ2186740.1 Transcription elongation factor spt6 [Coemansia sp. RSA 532]KAJ2277609.1 Transcription elongation factor spt6 [Coemansia sp. RSA 370]KAJ2536565.1 Transcription elongation factor spt6 [Coemansia sp. RSA 1935]
MSDASDLDEAQHTLSGNPSDEESYDTRRPRYSSDEEEDDDENDDELRRDGFVVDDDEEEEQPRRKKKKKRRRHLEQSAEVFDEEDLALVAENTFGVREQTPRLKRLKRGRGRRASDDDDELRAELDDLMDTNESPGADYADEPRRDVDRDDDLGLFGNEESDAEVDDYRAARRAERRGHANSRDERLDTAYEEVRDNGVQAGAHERTGAMASFLAEGMDAIDDDTWMELQDIFGSGEEYAFAMEAPLADRDPSREKTLADVFEPAELEAKMMTQRDEDIRTSDVPERMQMRATGAESLRPLSEDEIEEETTWVMRQLHSWLTRQEARRGREHKSEWDTDNTSDEPTLFQHADFANERFLAAVLSVLKLLSQDFYEVPFIARHRREVFVTAESESDVHGEEPPTREWLSIDDLWKLYDFDLQFRGLLAARRHLQNMVRRLKGEGVDDSTREISHEDEAYASELIASASGVEDIMDVTEWLQAHYADVIQKWSRERAGMKRVQNLGLKERAKRNGTDRFVERFGITARQVGDNVSTPGRHTVDSNTSEMPLDAARELVGTELVSPDIALKAAKATFSSMLELDPQLRRFVRAYCDEHVCVVVRPTDKGLREVTHDEHPAFAFKFLKQKPVAEFMGSAQFIELEKAVHDGLLRMQLSLSGEYRFDNHDLRTDDAVFSEDRDRSARAVTVQLDEHMRSSASGDVAAAWDTVRSDALFTAVRDHLLPQMWRETVQKLHQQAFDYVADACRRSLEQRIDVQAARTSSMRTGKKPRVAVVAGGGFDASSRGALRVVVVDEHGACSEDFSADSMRMQSSGALADGDGVAVLRGVLERQRIDVVAVSGMALQTRRLFDDVQSVVNEFCSHTGDDVLVTYASDEVARLWWDSDAARAELPQLRKEERYCVCVARTLQEPAAGYATLGRDLLHLTLHKSQRSVDQSLLFIVVERALVNVVSKIGVDINDLAQHVHKQPMLQYVSGLGSRKAHAILSRISGGHDLESRSDLIVRRLCTRTVFVNCASFLRVNPPVMDVLDDTRIHPEDYDLARKMALDALDIEDDVEDDNRRGRKRADGPSRYVAEVMRRSPEKLDELDLVKYAEELKRLLDVHKLETLKAIKHELQHPNEDPRGEFVPPDDAHVLRMLTGEVVGESLKEDGSTMVSGTIIRVQPRFAIARLDSGLEGFIGVANIADYRVEEASDELAPGQAIVAVVKRIDLEKMSLDLSMRKSDIDTACGRARDLVPDPAHVDPYFDTDAEAVLRERARAVQKKTTARMRSIPHPLFKPLNGREAEQYLATRPRGDCVIRPSSRGMDHIAITWKVGDNLFQHIDVREENKPHENALGLSFTVGDLSYSDLDELIALHVDPIMRKLDEVKRNPKFYDPETDPLYVSEPLSDVLGPNDYSQEFRDRRLSLWEKRVTRHLDTLAQSTGRGAYCVSLSLAKPGSLVLSFKPTPDYRGIIKWTARVEPNEYKLGERGRYPNISGLINGFKMMQTKNAKPREKSREPREERSGRSGRWGGTSSWNAPQSQSQSQSQWNSTSSRGWN